MKRAEVKALIKKLDQQMKIIGKDRDNLDALIGEYVQLKEDCREAYDHLQEARDALSRLV